MSNRFTFTSRRERLRSLLEDNFPVFATDTTAKCLEADYTQKRKVKNFSEDLKKTLPPNVVVRLKNKAKCYLLPQIFFAFFKDKLNEQKGTRTSLRWHYNIYRDKRDSVIELWFVNYMYTSQSTVVLSREQSTVYYTVENTPDFFDYLVDTVVAITAHFRGLHFRNRSDCVLYLNEYKEHKELRINRKVFENPDVFSYFHYNPGSPNNQEIDEWLEEYNRKTNRSEKFNNFDREGEEAVQLGSEMIKKAAREQGLTVL